MRLGFRTAIILALGLLCSLAALAQQPGPALFIDAASANQHPISPDVYGINFYWDLSTSTAAQTAAALDLRPTARRWGGNSTSTYHWKFDVNSLDNDWFFEVLPDTKVNAAALPDGSSFNKFVDQARVSGGKVIATMPILGWLPKSRTELCSFDVAKYGSQCKIDPYAQYHPHTCGNGIPYVTSCGNPSVLDGKGPSNPVYIKNDPTDAYAQFDQTFQAAWVRYLVTRYGKGGQGGVTIWSLDNEPIWWDSTHLDIHPNPYTYDELISVNTAYAAAIKAADPTALVSGPVGDNWASLFYSKKDIAAGWAKGPNYWSNPTDRNAHGGVALLPWYLQQMQAYEKKNGVRILDYLDMHAYYDPSNIAFSPAGNAATQALRLQLTRLFWDPTYLITGDYWIRDVDNNGAPVAPNLIPRLRQMVAQNYPGTKIAITEYNWGALDNINGALAQADLLGIFGREGLDAATLWGPPKPTDPAAYAFKMYRNYDGIGGTFGETGVLASSVDQGQLAIYGALRSDLNLTAVVINKTTGDLSSTVGISNFSAGASAHVWRYSAANLNAIVQQPDVAVNGGVTMVFPANSITLLTIPPASLPVPKPTVAAVTNVASYGQAIAPGQMVAVFGSAMGPTKLTPLQLDANGLVSAATGGVRILFDGVAAPMVYASATQCSAVVPYLGALHATTHVQVEYQGVRSDPLVVAVSPTGPGIFTGDASGQGQAAALNSDNVTPNSVAAPASPGSVVILYATGEGVTDPPGVDGRLAVDVLPKPLAAVSVDIGGLPATVQYAGAAPGNMPGLLQINAVIPGGVATGNQVPVHVTIGGNKSRDGVTIAVH